MSNWHPAPYKDFQWIVAGPQLLGGRLAIRGTRLSVPLILECLAADRGDLVDHEEVVSRVGRLFEP